MGKSVVYCGRISLCLAALSGPWPLSLVIVTVTVPGEMMPWIHARGFLPTALSASDHSWRAQVSCASAPQRGRVNIDLRAPPPVYVEVRSAVDGFER